MIEETNEERNVALYDDSYIYTDPESVTLKTPLESLNLNWREKDLPQKLRTKHVHSLHPYLGKFVPQLAEIFLRKFFQPGQTVYDPFAGSGTTLVQANELGIHAIGSDISAFNVLLSSVKTGKYDLKKLKEEVNDILYKTLTKTQYDFSDLPLFSDNAQANYPEIINTNEYLNMWFASRARYELITYRDLINSQGYEYKDVMRVILSRSARSARLTTHFDLDFPKKPQIEPYYCFKHSRTCSPVQEAFKFIDRYSKDTLSRIAQYHMVQTEAQVDICHADSRYIQLPKIDGVITSPPYVGLIDYHNQHHYAYVLFGLEDKRQDEIGPAVGGSSQRAKREYIQGITDVFQNSLHTMPRGAPLIVVAGDRHNLYSEIAQNLDVEIVDVIERHVNRRTGRRSGEFFESIFIWRKR